MRHPDWPERLEQFLRAREATPFSWGENDCATFAADCAAAITGADPFADLRRWRSAPSAWRALQSNGGLIGALRARLRETPIGMARRGDIGLIQTPRRHACVVVLGGAVVGPGRDGLMALPRAALIAAFEVG